MDYGIELHPWDIAEEGLEQTLAQVATLGATRLSLTAAWPGQAVMRPRAPAQRLHFPECGAVYFKPDKTRWKDAQLRPKAADLVMVDDLFATLPVRAQREGLAVEARVVFLPYVPHAAQAPVGAGGPEAKPFRPETLYVRNAFGDRLPGYLCPAREDVRRYLIDLVKDLARSGVESVVLERYGFPLFDFSRMPGGDVIADAPAAQFLMGVCFCDACVARGEAMNIEISPLAWRVRNFLERVLSGESGPVPPLTASPDGLAEIDELLPAYLRARNDMVGTLVRDLRSELREDVKVTAFPGSRFPTTQAWREGGEVSRLAAGADIIRLQGGAPDADRLKADLDVARRRAGGRAALSLRLSPYAPHGQGYEQFAEKVTATRSLGLESVVFAGLGELAHAHVKWLSKVIPA
ncbi:MAG: hypothetical protein ACYTKD_00995 [Planctomycetota bacterium]|jgi:hypothetical protein